jgi:hypothetical protein
MSQSGDDQAGFPGPASSRKLYVRTKMISDLLLLEFEEEVKKTRTMLERVPMK